MSEFGGYTCATFSGEAAPRGEIMGFRTAAFGRDAWDAVDAACWHLVVRERAGGGFAAYYRVLHWAQLSRASLERLSPIFQVYRPPGDLDMRVVELGRLCTPGAASMTALRALWTGVAGLMGEIGALRCFGMSTAPADQQAAAREAFVYARRLAADPELARFIPRTPLAPPGHIFPPETSPRAGLKRLRDHAFARLLSAYAVAGARFGPDAVWAEFGRRPCVLTSMQLHDYLRRTPEVPAASARRPELA
jgi:putative hemolysin